MDQNINALTGRVGQDPEIRKVGEHLKAGFSLAVKGYKDKTIWIDCEAWGKTAEIVRDYVNKGDKIAIEGELDSAEWEDKNTGKKRSKLYVKVQRVVLLPKSSETAPPETEDDVPF